MQLDVSRPHILPTAPENFIAEGGDYVVRSGRALMIPKAELFHGGFCEFSQETIMALFAGKVMYIILLIKGCRQRKATDAETFPKDKNDAELGSI